MTSTFATINQAYNATFTPNRLSVGLVLPIEKYTTSPIPDMTHHLERAQLAERLGFAALWLRDVPFNVPSFGDAGQMFDPFVYLGFLAARTQTIALATGSIILPLRHPAHVAKAAATTDVLSNGRLLMGVASGDRPQEYPAMNMSFDDRGERFRDSFEYIRQMTDDYPRFENQMGSPDGHMDMLPKPTGSKVPMLITGGSQQHPKWVAQNGDGWITYPRSAAVQGRLINSYRTAISTAGQGDKPVSQSLYFDLNTDPDAPPSPIHLGFRSGVKYLNNYLSDLQEMGVNHVAMNLRFNQTDMMDTLQILADETLSVFNQRT